MNSIQDQFEITALKLMYPGASPKRIKKLWKLAKEKKAQIVPAPMPNENLDRILCSIIRHEESQYERVLSSGLSKQNARGLISPIIRQRLAEAKGQ
jgi:hypothetical protein